MIFIELQIFLLRHQLFTAHSENALPFTAFSGVSANAVLSSFCQQVILGQSLPADGGYDKPLAIVNDTKLVKHKTSAFSILAEKLKNPVPLGRISGLGKVGMIAMKVKAAKAGPSREQERLAMSLDRSIGAC